MSDNTEQMRALEDEVESREASINRCRKLLGYAVDFVTGELDRHGEILMYSVVDAKCRCPFCISARQFLRDVERVR